MHRRWGISALCVALTVAATAPAWAVGGPGKAATIGGAIKGSAGSVVLDVKMKDNKPKLIKETVINDVPVNCSISGESSASPDLTGVQAKVRDGRFKIEEDTGQNLVFKGKFTAPRKAEGTIEWAFNEAGNDCATDGALEWKARPPSR